MTKVFVVLASVLAIALSVLTVGAAAQWANYRELVQKEIENRASETVRRMNLEAMLATTLAVKDDIIRQRDAALAASGESNRKLADELASVRNDLARRENEAVAAEAGRKKIEEILGVQTAELTSAQKQNQTLLTQNTDLQTRNQQINARLLEVTTQLSIATDQQRNLQEKLYAAEQRLTEMQRGAGGKRAPAVTEAPAGAVPAVPPVAGPIQGEITDVDGRYASINIGDTSGVVKGMTFMVFRGSTYLADLEIEEVHPKQAGGRLLTVVGDVRRGDRVRFGFDSAQK
jgi:ribosome-binding protein aMBF1 (putative translation factor)